MDTFTGFVRATIEELMAINPATVERYRVLIPAAPAAGICATIEELNDCIPLTSRSSLP